jgi:hypothetical protein
MFSQGIILIQLKGPFVNNMLHIFMLTGQGKLQVFEFLQEALKSNDCTTESGRLLSRESLLIIEGALMKILVFTIKRKNMHTSRSLKNRSRTCQSLSSNSSHPAFASKNFTIA